MKVNYGIACGLFGMSLCLAALLIDVSVGMVPEFAQEIEAIASRARVDAALSWIGSPLGSEPAIRQLMLLFGAAFLFLAALSKGPKGRLFQILEGALVIYGVLSFLPLPTIPAYAARFLVSVGMFRMLWKFDLLKGGIDKIGAVGLECLGIGYFFGSHWWFLAGGIFLTIYCAYWQYREPGALNALWTALNGPFAMASGVALILHYDTSMTLSNKIQLAFSAIVFLGGVAPFMMIANERACGRATVPAGRSSPGVGIRCPTCGRLT